MNSFSADAVLDVLHDLHDAEHVGIAGQLDRIDRQPDRNAGVEEFRGLRQAEADAQFGERRNADRRARGRHRLDLVGVAKIGMDDLHVLGKQAGFGDGVDLADGRARAAGMHRDRQAELARGFDLRFVDFRRNGGRRIVAAHAAPGEAERDQAVVGKLRPVVVQPLRDRRDRCRRLFGMPCDAP